MSRKKVARPPSPKARKPRASVSSAKSRRRQATSTTAPTQEHAAAQQPARQLRSRTAEDIANEQTADQLALRILAATVGEKVLKDMSALMDELLQSHLLDDATKKAMKAGSTISMSGKKSCSTRRSRTCSTNIPILPPSIICRSIPIQILRATPSS
jgi:hypothetical protein